MSKAITLKVTSAFLVGGVLAKAGELVEVTNTEAKDLLSRGKATLAISGDEPAVVDASEEGAETKSGEEQDASEEGAETKSGEEQDASEEGAQTEEKPSKKSKKSK